MAFRQDVSCSDQKDQASCTECSCLNPDTTDPAVYAGLKGEDASSLGHVFKVVASAGDAFGASKTRIVRMGAPRVTHYRADLIMSFECLHYQGVYLTKIINRRCVSEYDLLPSVTRVA